MEEYDYEIEYVKGKENKVADCISRVFPITSDTLKTAMPEAGIPTRNEEDQTNLDDQLPDMEIFIVPVIRNDRQLQGKEKIKIPPRKMREPATNTELETTEEETPEGNQWRLNPTVRKIKIKPNVTDKLWTQVTREDLSPFSEE